MTRKKKSLREFIRGNREEIDKEIRSRPGFHPATTLNDEDRRQWVLNDEPLYLWARSKGVDV